MILFKDFLVVLSNYMFEESVNLSFAQKTMCWRRNKSLLEVLLKNVPGKKEKQIVLQLVFLGHKVLEHNQTNYWQILVTILTVCVLIDIECHRIEQVNKIVLDNLLHFVELFVQKFIQRFRYMRTFFRLFLSAQVIIKLFAPIEYLMGILGKIIVVKFI